VQELNSHHQLGWWKTTYFKQYKVGTELQLVKRFPLDSAIIRTIVPNRYLRAAGAKPLPTAAAAQRAKRHRQHAANSEPGFPGKITVLNGVKAIEMAYKEHSLQHCKDVRRLALFTDGSSSSKGRSGSAVVYRKPEPGFVGWFPWQAFGFKAIGQKVGSSETECLAIIKAMDIARDLAQDNPGWLNTVYIYTDAKGVLDKLIATQGQGNGARRAMSDPLMQCTENSSTSCLLACICEMQPRLLFTGPAKSITPCTLLEL
jgi:ribonuclease HI